jgi:hypothetical protein
MSYPFLQKSGNTFSVRLNKDLYPKELLERATKEEPKSIQSFSSQKHHHLVKLKAATNEDYFAFLNYLVYLNRK